MELFDLDFMGVQRTPICPILETPFETGAKQRRQPFEKEMPIWTLTHRNMNQVMTQAWIDFFRSISLGLDKFYFDDIDDLDGGGDPVRYEAWMRPGTLQTHTIAGVTSVRVVFEAADLVEV